VDSLSTNKARPWLAVLPPLAAPPAPAPAPLARPPGLAPSQPAAGGLGMGPGRFEPLDPVLPPQQPPPRARAATRAAARASSTTGATAAAAKGGALLQKPGADTRAAAAANFDGPPRAPTVVVAVPRARVAAGIAVAVLVAAGGLWWVFSREAEQKAAATLGPTVVVDDQGKEILDFRVQQQALLVEALSEPDHRAALKLIDKAIALDPETRLGRDSLVERTKRHIQLGELKRAGEDLERLRRRNDVGDITETLNVFEGELKMRQRDAEKSAPGQQP
jgi:hypothetical protein